MSKNVEKLKAYNRYFYFLFSIICKKVQVLFSLEICNKNVTNHIIKFRN